MTEAVARMLNGPCAFCRAGGIQRVIDGDDAYCSLFHAVIARELDKPAPERPALRLVCDREVA